MNFKDRLFAFIYYDCERILFALRKLFVVGTKGSEPKVFGVNYVGYPGSSKGIGEAARSMMKIISAAGIPLAVSNIEHRWQRSTETRFSGMMEGNPYSVNIFHINADMVFHVLNALGPGWLQGRRNIGYWVWELEEFPGKWASAARCFDEIWTPSDFCRAAIQAVSPIPVKTMPHAVEVSREGEFTRSSFGLPTDSFVFLYVFDLLSHFERKNPLAVIEAFRRALPGPGKGSATLVLKYTGAREHPAEHAKIMAAAEGLPVKLFTRLMERKEVDGLLSVSDCYVSLHRSEGFGLTIAEAMALGKPVVATGYSGNMQFMNKSNSFPVRYTLKSIEQSVGPYRKGSVWAEPDIDHAAQLMRRIIADPVMTGEMGNAAARHMQEHFSPRALSDRLAALLRESER